MEVQTITAAMEDFYRIARLPPTPVNWEEICERQERAQKRLAEKKARLNEAP